MSDSPHSDVIAAFRELYVLLDELAAIPGGIVRLPSPETGRHAPDAVNTDAAQTAGYDDSVLSLMWEMPYLDIGEHEMFLELLPSTYPVSYIGPDMDDGYFESCREMLHDEEMPPTALRLMRSEIYGTEFIYDTRTSLMTAWKPIDNPDEVDDYLHVPAAPPCTVLNPIIQKYRTLEYLGTPRGIDFNSSLFAESGGEPPRDWGSGDARRWRAQYDVWAATRRLRDIYIECGWDVKAAEQTDFRREEFLRKRDRHWRDVVQPLIAVEEGIE
ncbi:hypothetical protein F4780DRAFT_764203 [Xylariomycetidae sp. FL0641]|nr:hypothetical protein F4780DRAFT_764203 [Xylariomycetidae sp. FL0641]